MKQCSHFAGFGPRSLSLVTAGDDLMHLGEGMEMLGLPSAPLAERAGTAAKQELLFCGSLTELAVCCAQLMCARGQGRDHSAPCTGTNLLRLRWEQCQQVEMPKIWSRGKQPVRAGCQLTDLPRRTNRSK